MSTQTVPPPTATFNSHCLQWIIFDEYQVRKFTMIPMKINN